MWQCIYDVNNVYDKFWIAAEKPATMWLASLLVLMKKNSNVFPNSESQLLATYHLNYKSCPTNETKSF